MRYAGALLIAAAIAAPAHAESAAIDAPAGRAGDAAVAIARQTGTSVVITDPAVSNRRVGAIRGRYSAKDAIKKLAKAAGAQAIQVGPMGWRLVAAPVKPPKPVRPRAVPAAPPNEPPPAAAPEDIVVVGSKRDVLLADYPGEVEMIDGKELDFGGAGGTEKITQRVPSVSSTHLGSGRNKLFIRGIADSSFTGPTQSTVGQYFGDLRLSYNAPDPDLRLTDLQRVEILEGPQGTLYGAGALGGILRLVPNPPQLDVVGGSAAVGGSATQHGAVGGDASATINLPVSGNAALRVSVGAESQGGYIDKPLLGEKNVNRTDIIGGRAAFRFESDSGWSIDLIGIGQDTAGHDSQYADRGGPPLTRAARVKEGFDADYAQGQVVIGRQFGEVFFKSSTGITSQSLEERYDATLPGGDPRLFVQNNDTTMIANETRLWRPLEGGFAWLVGGSFTRNRTTLSRTLGPPGMPAPATGVRNEVDEATLYGEATLRLADQLVASAGGRFTYSWLGGDGQDIAVAQLAQPVAQELARMTATRNEHAFLPSFSLVSNLFSDTSLYLRYQEGFRPGGLAIAGDIVTRFRNDHIRTFEFGARHGRPGAGPFEISANVSFTRWNDIQADFIDSAGLPSTANIGDGHIVSATVNGSAAIGRELRLDAGMTYNDSRVDRPIGDLVFARSRQVPNIARFAGRAGFEYQRELGDDLFLIARGWAQYVGKSRLGVGPELGEEQGDYVDSGLTVRVGRDGFGVTLGLSNLTDEKGNRFALGTPFQIGREQITPLRPRTLRLGLDASF
ncbi:MAG: TonB-dependent receptor [Candidatus Andeanibacterium colombiense]|uniref:TonB-dependent receptor n=1 Tax=Candidatus Andeanibacterium colombiense TaxID=3121345 RepID=A0AAJ5XAK8_9SPHN|nr:MAG: TonB-dependent receptor [Sphingomonadaceae bacterium]